MTPREQIDCQKTKFYTPYHHNHTYGRAPAAVRHRDYDSFVSANVIHRASNSRKLTGIYGDFGPPRERILAPESPGYSARPKSASDARYHRETTVVGGEDSGVHEGAGEDGETTDEAGDAEEWHAVAGGGAEVAVNADADVDAAAAVVGDKHLREIRKVAWHVVKVAGKREEPSRYVVVVQEERMLCSSRLGDSIGCRPISACRKAK